MAVGLRAAAHQFGLGFVPLFHERYDIVFTKEESELLTPLLDQSRRASSGGEWMPSPDMKRSTLANKYRFEEIYHETTIQFSPRPGNDFHIMPGPQPAVRK